MIILLIIITIPIVLGIWKIYTTYYALPHAKAVNLLNPKENIIGKVVFEPYSVHFNKHDILNFTSNVVECHVKVIIQMRIDHIEFTRKIKLLNGAYQVIGNLPQDKVKTRKNMYFFDKDIPVVMFKNIDGVKITE